MLFVVATTSRPVSRVYAVPVPGPVHAAACAADATTSTVISVITAISVVFRAGADGARRSMTAT